MTIAADVELDPSIRPTLDIDEYAALLGVSRSTAYLAARRGEIPIVRVGRRLRVPTAAVRRLLQLDEPASVADGTAAALLDEAEDHLMAVGDRVRAEVAAEQAKRNKGWRRFFGRS